MNDHFRNTKQVVPTTINHVTIILPSCSTDVQLLDEPSEVA